MGSTTRRSKATALTSENKLTHDGGGVDSNIYPHASVSPDRPGADVDEPELEETPHGQTTNSEGGSEGTTAKFRPSVRGSVLPESVTEA